MSDIALSLLVLGAIAMCVGAWLAWKKGDRKRAGLMLLLAVIMALNVAIWTIPGPSNTTLAEEARN